MLGLNNFGINPCRLNIPLWMRVNRREEGKTQENRRWRHCGFQLDQGGLLPASGASRMPHEHWFPFPLLSL